jgi:hypothetical protein
VIIYCISKGDTTLINWIYFSLNVLLLCFLSNNDGKTSTLKRSTRTANCIVYYSVFLLIGECIFTWIFGVQGNDIQGSNDMALKEGFPLLYDSLQLIGLRMYVGPQQESLGTKHTKEEHLKFFSFKCTSYIVYLLIGLYFSSKCSKELNASKALEDVSEEGFRRIFEFHNDNLLEAAKDKESGPGKDQGGAVKNAASWYGSALGESAAGAADHSNTLIGKIKDPKAYINRDDFEMFYIMFQYDPGFQAYK